MPLACRGKIFNSAVLRDVTNTDSLVLEKKLQIPCNINFHCKHVKRLDNPNFSLDEVGYIVVDYNSFLSSVF